MSDKKDKPRRAAAVGKKALHHTWKAIIWLALLPFRVLLLMYTLFTRFFLWLATLILVGYFITTTFVTGPLVLEILNGQLLGTYYADHIALDIPRAQVQIFNLRITHPAGHDLIHARRVATSVDSLALLFWGLKKAVGVSSQLPLTFRETRLDGYRVILPFGPDGFQFTEAFLPAIITPDDGPSGPPPDIMLSHIIAGRGEVLIDFGDWSMPITVQRLASDIRIRGPGNFILSARGIQIESFRMTGLLPEPITFIGEESSTINVARYRMDLDELEVHDIRLVHPDFEGLVHSFNLNFARDDLPVKSFGEISVLSPHRVEQVTGGHVFGAANVAFEMSGSVVTPAFRFHAKSPYMVVEDLPLEDLEVETSLDLAGDLLLTIPTLNAQLWGGEVRIREAEVEIPPDDAPEITLNACFDDLRPGLLAYHFGIEEALPYTDLIASGCCHNGRIDLGGTAPRIDGGIALTVDAGPLRSMFGTAGGTIEAFLTWNGNAIRWEGLSVTADIGHLSSVGYLAFEPEPNGRIDASLYMPDLYEIPMLAALGIHGTLNVEDLLFTGSMSVPEIHTATLLDDLHLFGEVFETVDLRGSLTAETEVRLEEFCFRHGDNQGCLSGLADLGPSIHEIGLPIPLNLQVDTPISVNLDRLPFVTLPLQGRMEFGPVFLSGTIHPEWSDTVSSLIGTIRAQTIDFAIGNEQLTTRNLEVKIDKKVGSPETDGPGPFSLELAVDRLSTPDLRLDRASVTTVISAMPGWKHNGEKPFFVVGSGDVKLHDFEQGPYKIHSVGLEIKALPDPEKVTAKGRIQLTREVGLSLSGTWLVRSMLADLDLEASAFPLVALPDVLLNGELRSLFEETRITTRLFLRSVNLTELFAERYKSVLKKVQAWGKVEVSGLERLPEPVSQVKTDFSIRSGRVRLKPLWIHLRNGTDITIAGSVWPLSEKVDLKLSVASTRLSTLRVYNSLQLPLDTIVAGDFSVAGHWLSPRVDGKLQVQDLVAADITLGNAILNLTGQIGDSVTIAAEEFFSGFELTSGDLSFKDELPETLQIGLSFPTFNLNRIVPDLPEMMQVKASGTGLLTVRFLDGEAFEMAIDIPSDELSTCVTSDVFNICLKNPSTTLLRVTSQGVHFAGLQLAGDGHMFDATGDISFLTGWNLAVGMGVDVARLPFLGSSLASYSGRLGTGKEPFHLSGSLGSPNLKGALQISQLELMPRQLGSEISINRARIRLSGDLFQGNLLGLIEEDFPIEGTYDEGDFAIIGWFRLAEWMPEATLLNLSGKEIYYQVPGEYRLVINPRVEIKLRDLTDESGGHGMISGEVFLSEGEFTRNFDSLIGSFSTAFSRSQARYSAPLTETLPFLKNMAFDLRIKGGNFAVSSRFPFGETELSVNMDLAVGGTWEELKLNDWMHIVPGGTITYKVVKRIFSITQGAVDFSGDPEAPYVDIEAMTEVPYSGSSGTQVTDLDEEYWGETVPIRIRLTGIYPNITPQFSSDKPGFDDADLQTLLLLGMTRKDLEGRSGDAGSSDVSINLLTEDVAGMVSKLLMAPFVDTVSLGFTTQGGIMAEAATKIGRAISLSTRVRKESEEQEYTAGIRFKITDKLSLEGRMKKREDQSESQTLYEAKFKYLIPLD
jgi:hypothetical protein